MARRRYDCATLLLVASLPIDQPDAKPGLSAREMQKRARVPLTKIFLQGSLTFDFPHLTVASLFGREGTIMPNTRNSLGRALTQHRFTESAEVLGIDAARLWAVMEIEAKRCGFLPDRRPVILFERHKFHERTGGRHSQVHADISNRDAGGYGHAGSNQHLRFDKAAKLDRAAALWSTSWGLGQVMGFNAELAGFTDGETMVREMCASEDAQLIGLVNFVKHNDLDRSLRIGDWTSFARGYNGPRYYINKYDDRLRGAYQKFTVGPMPDLKVREAQLLLTYLSLDPGPIDGWLGPATLRALNEYRVFFHRPEAESFADDDLFELREAAHGV